MLEVKYYNSGEALKAHTAGAAGIDLPITSDPTINPGEIHVVPTGIKVEIPEGYVGEVSLRSSSAKRGLVIPNAPGLIDSDYRGEVKVILGNISNVPIELVYGHRIAQMTFRKVEQATMTRVQSVTDLSSTVRGTGGLGSTGS